VLYFAGCSELRQMVGQKKIKTALLIFAGYVNGWSQYGGLVFIVG